jgi:hypothetical protein
MIAAIALGVLAIVGAALSRQLADEFKAWTPWIAERLIRRAVRKLPQDQRDRCEEEWRSHVNDTPGELGKLLEAPGCVWASRRMASELGGKLGVLRRSLEIAFAAAILVIEVPIIVLAAIAIKLESDGPVFTYSIVRSKDGHRHRLLKFRTP